MTGGASELGRQSALSSRVPPQASAPNWSLRDPNFARMAETVDAGDLDSPASPNQVRRASSSLAAGTFFVNKHLI